MGASRLDRALRVFAWVALVATVLALVSAALMVQVSAARGGEDLSGRSATEAAAVEESR